MNLDCPSEYYLLRESFGNQDNILLNYLYTTSDSKFEIKKVKGGIYPAIVTVNGFNTEGDANISKWHESICKLYPDNVWFHVEWNSIKLFSIPSFQPKFPVLNNLWAVANRNAIAAGYHLFCTLLCCSSNNSYIFFGHSLGAKVIYELIKLNNYESKVDIRGVNIFGGAITSDIRKWDILANRVNCKINNFYSSNDSILKNFFISFDFGNPIGINPIISKHVENYDTSKIVENHSGYFKNLSLIMNHRHYFKVNI